MPKQPIPPEIVELFQKLLHYANKGDLGIVATVDKKTGAPRYVLAAKRAVHDGDEISIEPIGYLSPTVFDEVRRPGDDDPVDVKLADEPTQGPPPMDNYNAVGIAEGWIDADEDRQLEAWQYLEDTGLGYQLQGWFGRRLEQLKLQGLVHSAPMEATADVPD